MKCFVCGSAHTKSWIFESCVEWICCACGSAGCEEAVRLYGDAVPGVYVPKAKLWVIQGGLSGGGR